MITDHKFRNGCSKDCRFCRKDADNTCSSIGEHTDYRPCNKMRAEHAEVEEWSTYQPRN